MVKNKNDLITLVYRDTGFNKSDLKMAFDSFIKNTIKMVKDGEELNIVGFGKIYAETIPSRKLWDLNNGGFRDVPEIKRPKIKFSDNFKSEINK